MQLLRNAPLAPYTSLGVGGNAETLITVETTDEIAPLLQSDPLASLHVLGYGANIVISDHGLPGLTLLMRSSGLQREGATIIAESGTWWDDLVQFAIEHGLWGLELTSAIPGSVGAAVVGNIAAYGQAVSDTLAWVDVLDTETHEISRLPAATLTLTYRNSIFQTPEYKTKIILRAAFTLTAEPVKPVTYQSLLDAADETETLAGRRAGTLEARKRAGSLWDFRHAADFDKTAGSFFRNPLVSEEQAERIMQFDETGKTTEAIRKMNAIHGGDQKRVSAAHVLLAAGFSRGQSWGDVKLHDHNLLKVHNTGNATASQIYSVSNEIIATVKQKLDITLTPEPHFIGEF